MNKKMKKMSKLSNKEDFENILTHVMEYPSVIRKHDKLSSYAKWGDAVHSLDFTNDNKNTYSSKLSKLFDIMHAVNIDKGKVDYLYYLLDCMRGAEKFKHKKMFFHLVQNYLRKVI